MPLFKDLFPNAKPGDIINETVKLTKSWYDCALSWDGCQSRTNWAELSIIDDGTEVQCCSTECAEKLLRYALEVRAGEAQQDERLPCKQKEAGSTPVAGPRKKKLKKSRDKQSARKV